MQYLKPRTSYSGIDPRAYTARIELAEPIGVHTHIKYTLSHDRGIVELSAQAVELRYHPDGRVNSECFSVLGSPHKRSRVEDMPRFNKKKFDAIAERIDGELMEIHAKFLAGAKCA